MLGHPGLAAARRIIPQRASEPYGSVLLSIDIHVRRPRRAIDVQSAAQIPTDRGRTERTGSFRDVKTEARELMTGARAPTRWLSRTSLAASF